VYPRLVATYVGVLTTVLPDTVVLTGHVVPRDRETGREDLEPDMLVRGPRRYRKPGVFLEVILKQLHPVMRAFTREKAARELVVLAPLDGFASPCSSWRLEDGTSVPVLVGLVVPLDDDLAPAVLSAVRDVLSH
jgi:hypothetical protein